MKPTKRATASRANGMRAPQVLAPTGGKGKRWMVPVTLPVDERAPYVDAAQSAGQTVGEWVAGAMREKLGTERSPMTTRTLELQAEARRLARERLEGRTDPDAERERATLDWLDGRARDNGPPVVATRIRADEAITDRVYGVTCEGGIVRQCVYLGASGLGYAFQPIGRQIPEIVDGDEMIDELRAAQRGTT